ncbi:hypothetical protein DSL72_007686 [Monilinia vaccinii-corymbosi]|uniref:Peptidase A22B, signal peptide peptidase n=1 Tax=Monilinia vaccinii-corymbosi TaxID=61207 RepID=A0A8A3PHM3_9HELO|nr:hypothetical protein DSL72_007686 [Monilinia vaccinii-corymbosi]
MENLKDILLKYGHKIYTEREMLTMEIRVILAALFPIYMGSHASLHRPASASPAPKSSSSSTSLHDEDEEEESRLPVEGLRPGDAIMFPLLASVALGTLYFIIKWLDDPAILSKILAWYFAPAGVFGVGRLAKDTLNIGVGFIFPNVWANGKDLFHVDQNTRRQVMKDGNGKMTNVDGVTNPLPGRLSHLNFPKAVTNALWGVRRLFKTTYTLGLHIEALLPHQMYLVTFTSMLGLGIGIATVTAFMLLDSPWYLTNVIGFGFSYASLQFLSPTTFTTGSLVLLGLFFYDITMVFYTPLMVTVASSLDVPIKLVFPGGKGGRGAMLGLGDIVLPGILIALALRFDLYLHYLYMKKCSSSSESPSTSTSTSTSNAKAIIKTPSATLQKPPYKPSTGLWGERFWTSSLSSPKFIETGTEGTRFSKPYFKAALAAYTVGMITTMVVLNVFQHAQPALLYLVPSVVGVLWGTAFARGELGVMWEYTEDGSLDEGEKGVGEGKKEEKRKSLDKDEGENKDVGKGKKEMKKSLDKDEEEKKGDEGGKKEERNKILEKDESEVQEIHASAEYSDSSSILSDGTISWPSPTLPPLSLPTDDAGSEAGDDSASALLLPLSSHPPSHSQDVKEGCKDQEKNEEKNENEREKGKNKKSNIGDFIFYFTLSVSRPRPRPESKAKANL